MFWPGIRKRIEEKYLSCEPCREFEKTERREPLISFPIPQYPFQVVGADLFTVGGIDYLLVVDYLSKFPVVKCLKQSIVAAQVISSLGEVFSNFGCPEVLISDNGPQFRCNEFTKFRQEWVIQHHTSSPLHPAGNGQVERWVGTVKAIIQKCSAKGKDWQKALLSLRNTPVDQNIPSPSELLQGRLLRDSVPVISAKYQVSGYEIEDVREKLGERQSKQKFYFDRKSGTEKSLLDVGQNCHFKTAKGKWISGTVTGIQGIRSYEINSPGGNTFRRNRVDIRRSLVRKPTGGSPISQAIMRTPEVQATGTAGTELESVIKSGETQTAVAGVTEASPDRVENERTTRSGRRVRLPSRFADYET